MNVYMYVFNYIPYISHIMSHGGLQCSVMSEIGRQKKKNQNGQYSGIKHGSPCNYKLIGV